MGAGSMGHQARLYVEPGAAPHTFDATSETYEFQSESLRKTETLTNTNGVRGTRSASASRTRKTQQSVAGTILFTPSPADFALWLPRILGGSGPALAETVPSFGVLVDRVAKTFQYTDCKVSSARIFGSSGGLVQCELSIVGKTEVQGTAAPVVAFSETDADEPFVFAELSANILAAARECFSFEIRVDNMIQPRFVNSLTATQLHESDRIVTVNLETPYTSDELDLLDMSVEGVAATLTLTNGTVSTGFGFTGIQAPGDTPTVTTRTDELRLTIAGTARSTLDGGVPVDEITVTNDAAA